MRFSAIRAIVSPAPVGDPSGAGGKPVSFTPPQGFLIPRNDTMKIPSRPCQRIRAAVSAACLNDTILELITRLHNPDTYTRTMAAAELCIIGQPAALFLIPVLDSHDRLASALAADVLQRIGRSIHEA